MLPTGEYSIKQCVYSILIPPPVILYEGLFLFTRLVDGFILSKIQFIQNSTEQVG